MYLALQRSDGLRYWVWSWAAWYDTCLLIKLMPKGVVFVEIFSSTGFGQEELLHPAYRMCCLGLSDAGSCSGLKGSSLRLNPRQHISVWTLNSALVLLPGFCVLFLHCSQQVAKLRRSFEHYQHLSAAEHGAQVNSACRCSEGVVLLCDWFTVMYGDCLNKIPGS